jgi:hypothetical protein
VSRAGRWAAVIPASVAGLLGFVVLTVVWGVASANNDARGYATATAITVGLVAGVGLVTVGLRRRGRRTSASIAVGAAVAIAILLVFVPFVVVALSM